MNEPQRIKRAKNDEAEAEMRERRVIVKSEWMSEWTWVDWSVRSRDGGVEKQAKHDVKSERCGFERVVVVL